MPVVLVTYPTFKGWNPLTGTPGAGFLVWVYKAGTVDTPLDSYSEHTGTVPNTNPVVLNSVGEADIWVKTAAKLVYTTPTGDPTAPIWVVDYYGEHQENFVVGNAIAPTASNNYVVTTVPAVLALTNNFQLTVTPNQDNLDTIGTKVFTGTGEDDLTPSGPYIGTTSVTFTMTIDSASEPAPAAPAAALSATAGVVTGGGHYVKVTHVTAIGESEPSDPSSVVSADGSHKIACTAIPVGAAQVLGRNIYMTKSAGAIDSSYYLVSHSSAVSGPVGIEGLSKAAACVVTWTAHGLSNGDKVVFNGITQTDWTALNSYAGVITKLTDDTFSIAVDTSAFAVAYNPVTDLGIYVAPTIPDNTTVIYDINTADANLVVVAPVDNTSSGAADTFKWKKDNETIAGTIWHTGVPITAVEQILHEGFTVTFATTTGHTYGDTWAVPVVTPARVNLDGLGSFIVYKNKGGTIVALDGHDMIAGYPAELILNAALNGWLLINPATPIFSTSNISAIRYRKDITAAMSPYTLLLTDQGKELNCVSAAATTINLLSAPGFANRFVYIYNRSADLVTINAGTYKIYGIGLSTFILPPGMCIQIQTNGVDWHILTMAEEIPVGSISAYGGTSEPSGYFLCRGTAKSRKTYARLFSVIGTTYGVGDGSTTFNLPDLQQRFPLGKAVSGTGSTLGAIGGLIDTIGTLSSPTTSSDLLDYDGLNVAVVLGNNVGNGWRVGMNIIADGNPPYQVVNFIIKY